MKAKSVIFEEARKSLSQGKDNKITFRTARNGTIVLEKQPVPSGEASTDQLFWRDKYRTIAAAWNGLSAEQKAEYTAEGALRAITGFNQYLSEQLLLNSKTTTYTTASVTNPSKTTRAAWCLNSKLDEDYYMLDQWVFQGGTELTTAQYALIATDDENRLTLQSTSGFASLLVSFLVDIPPELITQLKFVWKGRSVNADWFLSMWRTYSGYWSDEQSGYAGAEQEYSHVLTGSPLDYMDKESNVRLAITLTDEGTLPQLIVNNLRLEVTHYY